MPRNRWTPAKDRPYWDHVFGLGPCPIPHAYATNEARMVRALFVQELGWTRSRLEAYRYRFVVELSRSRLDPVMVRLKPPAAYAREMDDHTLDVVLKTMGELPFTDGLAYFQRTVAPIPEVEDVMDSYRILLSKNDHARICALSRDLLGAPVSGNDARNNHAELSAAIVGLLHLAFTQEAPYAG